MTWKFYIETFGCKVNQYESQIIREAWQKLGGQETDRADEADYICINSCAITGKAERDSRNAVFRMKREAQGAKIVLTGCAAQLFREFRPRKGANWAEPDLCVAQEDKEILLNGFFPNDAMSSASAPALTGYARSRPVIKVQDGCSQNCTYCIVPQTRGKPVSRNPREILAECRAMLDAGRGELVISGINLRQYGKDKPEYGDFWDLLAFLVENLDNSWPEARLRISSLEPGQLSEKGLDILSRSPFICPHIHLSLQHASPGILRKMGRGHYDMEDILNALGRLRSHRPLWGLGADILVGFPGETEEDLELLRDFIKKSGLTYAHVFPYSRRPGTPAASFCGQINFREKQKRGKVIREYVRECGKDFLRKCMDLPKMRIVTDVAPHNMEKDMWHGVNEFYTPCYFHGMREISGGIMNARPVGFIKDGLEVEIISED